MVAMPVGSGTVLSAGAGRDIFAASAIIIEPPR
jgi:hypothetical protein